MTAAAALTHAEAAGVHLHLDHTGMVRMTAATAPAPGLLTVLRQHREEVAAILAQRRRADFFLRASAEAFAALQGRDPDSIEAEERAAVFGISPSDPERDEVQHE